MPKYEPLMLHLKKQHPREITITFDQISALLETPLPRSARLPQFWSNTTGEAGHVQREAWRTARYNAFLQPDDLKVRFVPIMD